MTSAPEVTLEVPRVLEPVVGDLLLRLRAPTVDEALEAACVKVVALRHHLMTPEGGLRPHILVLHNGRNLDRRVLAETRLTAGDEIVLHQAISGG